MTYSSTLEPGSNADLYERRYQRERRARLEAERLLELKARELDRARNLAEAALNTLQDAIDSLDEGFLLLDKDEVILLVNQRYRELYPEIADIAVPGTPFVTLIEAVVAAGIIVDPPPDADFVQHRLDRMRQADGPWEQRLANGRILLINEHPTAQGGYVSLHTDVTSLRHGEMQARWLGAAMEAAIDGMVVADAEGKITYANRAMAEMLGLQSGAQLIGLSSRDFYAPDELARYDQEIRKDIKINGQWRGEARALRVTGEPFVTEVSLSRLDDGGIVATIRDVTERNQALEQRTRLQEQLFRAQKMDAIGKLAGGIAHDFNNILTSMLGYASFLVEDLNEGSELQGFAKQIVTSGNRATKLVQQILAFSRQNDEQAETVPIARAVDETADMLRSTLAKTIDLIIDQGTRDAFITGDATQLSQVLMNLCVNARDAIGDGGGTIRIETGTVEGRSVVDEHGAPQETRSPDPGAAPAVLVHVDNDGSSIAWIGALRTDRRYVRIAVSDNGSGMPPEVLSRIFDPFFTTKPIGSGTGLGLSAVHGIVTAHSGALRVESRPGYGTRFELYFPAVEPGQTAGAEGDRFVEGRGAQETVLVVDDEVDVGGMTSLALKRLGFRVDHRISGIEALAAVRAAPQRYAAIITDQIMPQMTGLELTKTLRNEGFDRPIIVCTGYAEAIDEELVATNGGDYLLFKPVRPRTLGETLRALLDARSSP